MSSQEFRNQINEILARARSRIGIEMPVKEGWNETATKQAIKHFAWVLAI